MIHGVSANQRSFHKVSFSKGLNVVLAERSEASTEKDTRNGLGKSTLIEVIDFCLGSSAKKGSGLVIEPLEKWAFTLDATIATRRVSITRSVVEPNHVVIDGNTDGWIDQPDVDEETGERLFTIERWRALLGWALFGVPRLIGQNSYVPSYRSLVSYMVRKRPDAYQSPFRHFRQQHTWDIQLHTAYLLGMNWEYAARWQGLRDREERVKAIETAIKTGALAGAGGTVGELEAQRIQLEEHAAKAKEALRSFRVHPQYEMIQRDADRLTKEIHQLTNANVEEQRRLTRYEESVKEERPPAGMSLERLYHESGLVFPDAVRKTLDQAREFHHQIVGNRREFLDGELAKLRETITARQARIVELTDERAKVMEVLQAHGALHEMVELQERYVKLQGELDRLTARLNEMKSLTRNKREVKTAKAELVKLAETDHEQRRESWSTAIRLYNEHSEALYRRPGKLIIDLDETGYKFQVEIDRAGSEGIEKMKIFCFDMVALQMQQSQRHGVDFVVHDTLMYDSVDVRQRALALERAHEVTSEMGCQYICTMNSDMVPYGDFSRDFDFEKHVRVRLSDSSPAGSLLGIRFERPRS